MDGGDIFGDGDAPLAPPVTVLDEASGGSKIELALIFAIRAR